ncbi:MAG: DNA replication and repair protein RecF [Bifidobacterium aquikefiri]|uniref:DNA replication and repair protein RecF n=1 Tax=Bifidobacterium aquikefiri TaxID=1653207 RepID=A0A261GBD1_9BIFI|nr:DNA replication and repair protein RecF [Bifidobacterium aquikefiri]OZG68737.1 DNA recombination protein RecF [Bifidobacterium aquikefiri]
MYISRLALDHFRSWDACVLDFDQGINILQGRNGLGKTNIVESIEVLATGSSQRTTSMLPLIQRGSSTAVVRANVVENASEKLRGVTGNDKTVNGASPTTLEMSIHARGANRMRVNAGHALMMKDVQGLVSCVSFSPQDQHLVTDDPAARRVFLNQAGMQLDRQYGEILQRTRHIAQQRVALLKQLSRNDQFRRGESGQMSSISNGADTFSQPSSAVALSGLEVWTGQFIEAGVELTNRRKAIIEELNKTFPEIYRQLSGSPTIPGQGEAQLAYKPSFSEVLDQEHPFDDISAHFERIFRGELARGFNLIGPQRDDVEFMLNGFPAREYASNGEQWTLAIALKMSLYQALVGESGNEPIIVLDDVFAQLDEHRRAQIIHFASQQHQVLITVAAASDIPEFADAHIIDIQQVYDRNQYDGTMFESMIQTPIIHRSTEKTSDEGQIGGEAEVSR